MGRNNVLSDALRSISNAERCGKRQVLIRPSSKTIIRFLKIMQKYRYIDDFTKIEDHRSGKIIVKLLGRINKCRAISPRYDIKLKDSEKWISNILPSRQFGIIVLTSSCGIIDHKEALQKNTGGKILGFFY
jgi:small subunit ribosomal protein S15Ae